MARGKSEKKSKKQRKAKEEESIVFHDCESDNELIKAISESQPDLSLIAQTLEDPSAFHKELQEIVSTTQQLLYKFDSQYKPTYQRYGKKSNRKTKNVSESDRSIRSSKSLLLEIHFQVPIPVPANNIMYHQVSTHNENTFQVLPTPACFKTQPMQQTQNLFENIDKPIICNEKQKPIFLAGDNKNILKTESQTNISEKSLYITPKTSASGLSILTSSQLDIQLLHSQSKLLTLKTLKNNKSSQSIQKPKKPKKSLIKTQEYKQEKSVIDLPSSTSVNSNTERGTGADILFLGKRFLSSISTYMGGYVEESERKPDPTCKIPKKSSLSPKVLRSRQQKVRRKPKSTSSSTRRIASSSKQFSAIPQFSFPSELTALGFNAQTMPAVLMFMPPSVVNSNSQQDQQPITLQALCIPFMIPADQPSQNPHPKYTELNRGYSSTKEQDMVCTSASKLHLDINQKASQTSCTSFITDKTDCSCNDPSEIQDSCIQVTQMNEVNEDGECGGCDSDTTLVPSVDISPPIPAPEEPMEGCCARSKKGNCVECRNITIEERESQPLMKNFKKIKTPCFCGLKYSEIPNTKVPCTCNADGHLNEDCKLPLCIDKYGVCPCDCDNKESIVKCCKEAFEETCICADYNVPKFFRLALPQHKDLNLCIKCRFDPSPLIDSEGRVFCPGDCGCCLCPWHTRPTLSKDNLMLHEKVRVCVCRDRGTIFNLSPKNSKCNNLGNFDLCPCRERAEAKFLELFEKEMFKVNERELIQLSGPAVTLKDVREVIPFKDKPKSSQRKKK